MDSLQKARQFIAQKASRLALAVVPLAALTIAAIPAAAGQIAGLPTGPDCQVFPSNLEGSCYTFEQSPQGGNPNLNWIAMGGGSSFLFSGGGLTFDAIDGNSGSGSFLPSGSMAVSWDFFIEPAGLGSSQSQSVAWSVFFQLDMVNSSPSFFTTGSVLPGNEVTGQGVIIIPTSDLLQGYEITLSTNASLGIDYAVDIPGNTSLDINPLSTPEPGTFLLMTGAGALLFLRRKKRA